MLDAVGQKALAKFLAVLIKSVRSILNLNSGLPSFCYIDQIY